MNDKTVFKKIIDQELRADIVYEDELCIAFHDIQPAAPIHVLVIPKKEVVNLAGLTHNDSELAGHLLMVVKQVAQKLDLDQGYRVVANVGQDGGQSVDHLHFHILGGRQMGWPPG